MTFQFTSIAEYQNALRNGMVSCIDVVDYYLNEIEKNKHLNAVIAVFDAEARKQAEDLDASLQSGEQLRPLHGVIVTIKDVLCYKGHEVTASSNMLKGFRSLYTATAVQRLIDAGAIIIGVTNCDEFAMGSSNENSAWGPTLNAADNTKVPGGSSGGSAVAVQAGLCMVSLGSDTGGSVRQPADFCGVVGLKPTYGRISRYGLIAYGSSFDCIGIFGRTVEDVALVYDNIAGEDPLDATSLPWPVIPFSGNDIEPEKKYRFAYFDATLHLPGLDPEIKNTLESFFSVLRNRGHVVESLHFDLLDYIVPTYYVLTTAEASSNLSRYDGIRFGHRTPHKTEDLTEFYEFNRSEGFGNEVKRRILLGSFVLSSGYYDAYFTKAQQVRRMLYDQVLNVFKGFDALVMPVSPTTAFSLGGHKGDPVGMYLADIYTVFANLTGVPGLAIPGFRHSNGLPFGVQVMVNHGDELTLHRIGKYMQGVLQHPDI
ncbi:MAG: Asp-tRNA(Asn)/Glu-tRNA(Gln) amidotransferase subunit GatA [Chitinophagaceae bacterium]|nr:Asp-tRNA(Asn)/Glu-tRNA(Gln) amidotransferase subunit GatA [Chitinophagaceae bacterium]